MQSGATEEVLFRAGDIVSVRSVTGEMWVAQLKQPIIMRSPSAAPNGTRLGTFASARVACRLRHTHKFPLDSFPVRRRLPMMSLSVDDFI